MALDAKTLIPLINKRGRKYGVSLRNGDSYHWQPATDEFEDVQELEFRDVQWLNSTSATFKEGYLYIDNLEVRKRFGLESKVSNPNQLTREEIIGLLKGKLTDMKKGFEGIDNRTLLREIVETAKELKIDSNSKLKYLSEISGIPVEMMEEDEKQ